MIVGERIKRAIEEAGLTQEQVAAHAEMSLANLYKIYKRDSIESRYLVKIANILHLPYSYFLDEEPDFSSGNYQRGVGNAAGNHIKQKIMSSGNEGVGVASSAINVERIQHELELCKAEKVSLEEKLVLKDEIIELLRGRKQD
ncbi:helix-turn-helix domain-containing protein [Pontibacter pamirensis]|uniref:helix-turn-helix domain-containing protein n=1 Tax=Pontibacter pamirensis TaxID=2562824 RepID=UPI00138A06A7|nr:helix-turn-helix transcriptional regulator [Pontibacter pamirensis]